MNNKHKKFKINKGIKPQNIKGNLNKNINNYPKHMTQKNNQII